jgi:hypothetical protein
MIDLKNLPDDYEPPALYNMLVGRLCVHGFEPPSNVPKEGPYTVLGFGKFSNYLTRYILNDHTCPRRISILISSISIISN